MNEKLKILLTDLLTVYHQLAALDAGPDLAAEYAAMLVDLKRAAASAQNMLGEPRKENK